MSIPAPPARLVDALSGAKAPAKFFEAMADADAICADLDELCELRARVGELEASERLARADADDAAETIGLLIAERDDLAERLVNANEGHKITLGWLADAKREKRRLEAELATANAQLKRMQATR